MIPVKTFSQLPIVAETTEIPRNVLVPCPKIAPGKQKTRHARMACPQCDHFEGIAKRYVGEPKTDKEIAKFNAAPWSAKYAIRCVTILEIPCDEYYEGDQA